MKSFIMHDVNQVGIINNILHMRWWLCALYDEYKYDVRVLCQSE